MVINVAGLLTQSIGRRFQPSHTKAVLDCRMFATASISPTD